MIAISGLIGGLSATTILASAAQADSTLVATVSPTSVTDWNSATCGGTGTCINDAASARQFVVGSDTNGVHEVTLSYDLNQLRSLGTITGVQLALTYTDPIAGQTAPTIAVRRLTTAVTSAAQLATAVVPGPIGTGPQSNGGETVIDLTSAVQGAASMGGATLGLDLQTTGVTAGQSTSAVFQDGTEIRAGATTIVEPDLIVSYTPSAAPVVNAQGWQVDSNGAPLPTSPQPAQSAASAGAQISPAGAAALQSQLDHLQAADPTSSDIPIIQRALQDYQSVAAKFPALHASTVQASPASSPAYQQSWYIPTGHDTPAWMNNYAIHSPIVANSMIILEFGGPCTASGGLPGFALYNGGCDDVNKVANLINNYMYYFQAKGAYQNLGYMGIELATNSSTTQGNQNTPMYNMGVAMAKYLTETTANYATALNTNLYNHGDSLYFTVGGATDSETNGGPWGAGAPSVQFVTGWHNSVANEQGHNTGPLVQASNDTAYFLGCTVASCWNTLYGNAGYQWEPSQMWTVVDTTYTSAFPQGEATDAGKFWANLDAAAAAVSLYNPPYIGVEASCETPAGRNAWSDFAGYVTPGNQATLTDANDGTTC